MQARNRLVATAAAVAATVVVTGCGTSTGSEAGSAAAGGGGGEGYPCDADEVTIGGLWAQSGPQAAYGEWFANGTEMAVEDVNAEGGIGGQTQIRLQVEDTRALPEPAVVAFQGMVADGIQYVLSSFSSQTLALAPIAANEEVVLVNGGAQSDALGEQGPFLFNTIPLLRNESAALAEKLYEDGVRSAAIIYTSDDGGEAARENFEAAFTELGGEIAGVESAEFGGTDFRSQLTKLRSTDPEVLLLGAFGQDSNNIISQVREIGWDVPLANTSWVAIPAVLENPAAEGLRLTTIPFEPSEEFQQEYQEKYGEAPESAFIGNYYDGVTIFAEAFQHVCDSGAETVSGAALADAIREIGTFDSVYGSELTFEEGTASRPIDLAVIEGGAVRPVG
ncbi:ABC transporter substrate-binding protein [Geodermatophilus sp. DSM 44513]|uniref:ABC transporter substrate-binding protein n=1 Tax=Geodermatophilus sp. DSM 44513 TaxID=1528104 RepID=UPI00141245EE|nr:penicillin-binding protein activator [Geodermatophilus sp. DSM 44513]WNV76627.1 ABC transporter substrate-binding protein [Geodermatophilus sp. DSM 44513]